MGLRQPQKAHIKIKAILEKGKSWYYYQCIWINCIKSTTGPPYSTLWEWKMNWWVSFSWESQVKTCPMIRPQSEETRSVVPTLGRGLARAGSNLKSLGYMVLREEDTKKENIPEQVVEIYLRPISLSFIWHLRNTSEFIMCSIIIFTVILSEI